MYATSKASGDGMWGIERACLAVIYVCTPQALAPGGARAWAAVRSGIDGTVTTWQVSAPVRCLDGDQQSFAEWAQGYGGWPVNLGCACLVGRAVGRPAAPVKSMLKAVQGPTRPRRSRRITKRRSDLEPFHRRSERRVETEPGSERSPRQPSRKSKELHVSMRGSNILDSKKN